MESNPKFKYSVLFICSANQCRSPMAEVIFRQILSESEYRLDEWLVGSAGCWAYNGFPATESAEIAVSEMGLDLSGHKSKGVSQSLLDKFNLVLCMEHDHKTTLQRNFPEAREKVFLLSEMTDEEQEIDDPIGLSLQDYLGTVEELRAYMNTGLERIVQHSSN